ncbi:MAG TPA: aminotransferase class III-fold pyridoxal phosphate-dependent enzyme [Acidimicrobiia bacterium]|nr:aminotransferase class III-fold pyridoxal phosphate-dependent enzyme [Acidimicrobiia bacterium]
MGLQGEASKEWFQRASAALVNGVSSQFRYWGDDDTLVIEKGEGGYLVDVDGRRYLDLQCGFGPIILGHGDPAVSGAVAEAAAEASSFAMTQRREVEAAEKILAALKWPARMRFTNTGTEATMHSIRLARGVTGRDVVVKFEGQYHGMHDYVLFSTAGGPAGHMGSRLNPIPWQSSSGIPEAIRSYIRTLPFNDLEMVEKMFRDQGGSIAAVIVEPMLGNAFGILPADGFLAGLRRLCDEYGALLIFDEVKTGFRLGLGGAVAHFGVEPDIGTYAKALGNGFPVAAIALGEAVVEGWQRAGIAQAGTYSGNAVAAAAASATIERLADGQAYAGIEATGRRMMDGLAKVLADRGVAGHVVGHPAMFSVFLAEEAPTEFRDAVKHDSATYDEVAMRMIAKGVMPCPDAREPWFVCAAQTREDADLAVEAFADSLDEVLAG